MGARASPQERRSVPEPEFRALFAEHFAFVCRSLRRLGVRDADLADVAQEVFVVAHRQFGDFDRARSAKAWLFAYARGFAANYRRLGWHRATAVDENAAASSGRLAERVDARAKVASALSELDEEKRTLLVLHDMEGVSAPELAKETGTPLNTLYARIRAARQAFRDALAEYES